MLDNPSKYQSLLETSALTFRYWKEDHENAAPEDQLKWLSRIAERVEVDLCDLADEVGLGRLVARRRGAI